MNTLLNRKTETKHIGQFVTTNAAQTGVSPFPDPYFQNVVQTLGQGSSGQYWQVALPAMVQGGIGSTSVSDVTRIGDRIEPTALKTKLNIRLGQQAVADIRGAQATPIDLTVYVFYGYIKSLKTYQGATALVDNRIVVDSSIEATTAMSKLLDKGDLTFATFDGSQQFAQLPLSSYVGMKVKKIHLRQASGWINTNFQNGSASPNTDSQNTIRKEVTLKWKLPSKLEYRTATDIYPDNCAPVFAVGYVYNDAAASTNQAAPIYGDGDVEYTAFSSLYFKDHQ